MGAKEYLSQALWLDQRINSKLELLETLRALAMKVSVNLTEEKVSGGKNTKSHMENTIAKIVDLEKEINRDINRLVGVKAEIMDTISQVDDPICQLLLEMRYVVTLQIKTDPVFHNKFPRFRPDISHCN